MTHVTTVNVDLADLTWISGGSMFYLLTSWYSDCAQDCGRMHGEGIVYASPIQLPVLHRLSLQHKLPDPAIPHSLRRSQIMSHMIYKDALFGVVGGSMPKSWSISRILANEAKGANNTLFSFAHATAMVYKIFSVCTGHNCLSYIGKKQNILGTHRVH